MKNRNHPMPLKVIHAAMLGGTLVFLSVALFLTLGREGPGPSVDSPLFRWAWLAFGLVAVFGAGFLRGRLGRSPDEARVQTTGILIWALAEATALFGIVATIVTGDLAPGLGATMVGVFLMIHHRPSQLG